ncbi:MAG: 4-carboxy-4-hydroxy-2-oxoadipate aldolase, partial [uncultured Ramlibacter sp.]
ARTRCRLPQHPACRPRRRRRPGEIRLGHRARGHGTRRPAQAVHAADLPGRAGLRHRGDRAAATRRQLDDACGGRADPAGRCRRRRRHRRMLGRLLRGPAGHVVPGPRCACPGDRRRCARRQDPGRDAVPRLEQGHQFQGHDQGHPGLGEHPGGVRRHAGQPGRRDRRGRRRRGGGSRRHGGQDAGGGHRARSPRRREARQAGVRRARPGHVQDARAAGQGRLAVCGL